MTTLSRLFALLAVVGRRYEGGPVRTGGAFEGAGGEGGKGDLGDCGLARTGEPRGESRLDIDALKARPPDVLQDGTTAGLWVEGIVAARNG
jgi:hypothetical protein